VRGAYLDHLTHKSNARHSDAFRVVQRRQVRRQSPGPSSDPAERPGPREAPGAASPTRESKALSSGTFLAVIGLGTAAAQTGSLWRTASDAVPCSSYIVARGTGDPQQAAEARERPAQVIARAQNISIEMLASKFSNTLSSIGTQ
jgi:hypothetical protein